MKFYEAVTAANGEKRIRRGTWEMGCWIQCKVGTVITWDPWGYGLKLYEILSHESLTADDWIVERLPREWKVKVTDDGEILYDSALVGTERAEKAWDFNVRVREVLE